MTAPVVFDSGRYNGRTLREWLPEAVQALVKAADPLQIVLFGSLAEGTEGPDSDIDLLVVVPSVEDKLQVMLDLRKATRSIPAPLDIIPSDREEIKRRGQDVGSVLAVALRHGQVVHDRAVEHDPSWTRWVAGRRGRPRHGAPGPEHDDGLADTLTGKFPDRHRTVLDQVPAFSYKPQALTPGWEHLPYTAPATQASTSASMMPT